MGVVRWRGRGWLCSFCTMFHPLSSTCLLLLLLVFSGDGDRAVAKNYTTNKRVSSMRMDRIKMHLERINKPAVRSIESPDGDVIDCVPRHKQPALDHPLLKNHIIQRVPPKRPIYKEGRGLKNYTDDVRGTWQTWHTSGHCPMGTVPVRRTSVDDVLRAKSVYHYGKKSHRTGTGPLARAVDAPDVVSGNGHEHAIAYTGTSQEVYGARATINVWDPSVQITNEFSLSQIWILSGSFDGSDLNSIEAGWQSGFVQTNNKIAIGAAISPVSLAGGSQFDITILIWKDPTIGNWWMSFGDTALVGYWPAELFSHLTDHATMVEWGGEVVNMRSDGAHTSTQMGSGRFPVAGFRQASYFRNLEIVDADNSLSSAEAISTLAENTNCYDIQSSTSSEWGTYFYFGGPGKNPNCP